MQGKKITIIVLVILLLTLLGYLPFKTMLKYKNLSKLQNKIIIIYTRDKCYFCKRAKKLLNNLSLKYEEINLTDTKKRKEILSVLRKNTLPQIFVGEEYLGDSDMLSSFYENGELSKMIQ